MSDNVRIENPVKIQDKSHERVAFDLMQHIANYDKKADQENDSREYWFTLYRQCWKATDGSPLKRILTEE